MWANFLLAMTAPIVIRVLATLGLGFVTYTGLDAVVQLAYQMIQTSFNGLPLDIAALVYMSGLPSGMSIILSAVASRILMMQLTKIQRL